MADIVSQLKRSEMMSGIKGKDTQPEIFIRNALHRRGYRYRLHVKSLPGKPDIVLHKYRAIIFVQGCFWHGHDCHLFKWPQSQSDFWQDKINKSKIHDSCVLSALKVKGWRVLTVWECAIKGKERLDKDHILDLVIDWLHSGIRYLDIRGQADSAKRKIKVSRD